MLRSGSARDIELRFLWCDTPLWFNGAGHNAPDRLWVTPTSPAEPSFKPEKERWSRVRRFGARGVGHVGGCGLSPFHAAVITRFRRDGGADTPAPGGNHFLCPEVVRGHPHLP